MSLIVRRWTLIVIIDVLVGFVLSGHHAQWWVSVGTGASVYFIVLALGPRA